MSKIYEALRQAELDRAKKPSAPQTTLAPEPEQERTGWQSKGERAGLEPAQEAVVPPSLLDARPGTTPGMFSGHSASIYSGVTSAGVASAEPVGVPAERIDQLASASIDPHALDLTGVRAVPWTPALEQLPALQESGSAVEQFRSLRSRLFEFRDLNSLKSVMVSSGLPQEGKTFVAVNLAIAFARHKSARVLLIDGDMRRSRVHSMLGTPQGPGLTEYLSGKSSLSEVMQRPDTEDAAHPVPAGLGSVTFIPGGFDHSKAADLSGNHRFERLIESVSPFFDWIVVDSSPVNLVSDGVNLARGCDAVLLVARGGVTKYEAAQRALGELKASKVLGFVLNAVQDVGEAGGYYGYGNYEPYYNPAEAPPETMVANAR